MIATAWLATLIRASVEGGALLLLIWGVVSFWPRMPAAARCGLWWVGSLRMLVGMVPLPAVPVPWPVPWPTPWKAAWPSWTPAVPVPVLELGNAVAGGVVAPAVSTPPRSPIDLIPIVLVAVWGAGVVVGLVILARRLGALRRAWRAARPFEDPRVAAWQTEWAVAVGRGRVPEVRAGTAGQVPVTFGALRPGLLLPPDSSGLSDDALRMVLAHEMSHVRRRDPLLGSIPAAAQLLFWFFPLVRFAAHEYLAAREQASDADALRATGVAPGDYGALLLDYGVSRMSDAPGAAYCGSRGVRDLKRRLDMLSRTVRVPALHRVGAAVIVLVIVALGFAPVRFVGADSEKSTAREDEARALAEKRRYETETGRAWKAAQVSGREAWKQEERAYRKAVDDGMVAKRIPIAYMIKIQGQKGTRGAVDQQDMESARRLDDDDRTAVYFRLGEEMWLTTDPRIIESVQEALAPEDRDDERMRVMEGMNQAYEHEQMKVETGFAELQEQKAELEAQRADLDDRIERLRKRGDSTQEAIAERAEIEDRLQSVWRQQADLDRARQQLSVKAKSSHEREKIPYAERQKLHERVMESIADIARRAIEDKRAEPFEP